MRAVRLWRRLKVSGARYVRSCRAPALLWTQVALYPAYTAWQTTRTALNKAQAVATVWRQRLGFILPIPERRMPPIWPADWAIVQVLATVIPRTTLTEEILALDSSQRHTLAAATTIPIPVVTASQLPGTIQIQGVASCLQSRAVILVSTTNQVLDCLSAQQQAAIAAAIAACLRMSPPGQRQTLASPSTQPLPAGPSCVGWPMRVLVAAIAWLQSSLPTAAHRLERAESASTSLDLLPTLEPGIDSPPLLLPQRSWLIDYRRFQSCRAAWITVQTRLKLSRQSPPRFLRGITPRSLLPAASGPGLSEHCRPPRSWLSPLQTYFSARTLLIRQWLFDPAMLSVLPQTDYPEGVPADGNTPPLLWAGLAADFNEPVTTLPQAQSNRALRSDGTGIAVKAAAEDWINVEVLAEKYLDPPLMWLLRGIDWLLVRVEWVWQWLWQRFPRRL